MRNYDYRNKLSEVTVDEVKVYEHDLFGDLHLIDEGDLGVWFRAQDIGPVLGITREMKRVIFNSLLEGSDYKIIKVYYDKKYFENETYVTESVLYRFLMEGETKVCDTFRWWLCETVLPLHKTIYAFNLDDVSDFIEHQAKVMDVAIKYNDPDATEQARNAILYKILEAGVDQGIVTNINEDDLTYHENPHMVIETRVFHKDRSDIPSWLGDMLDYDDRDFDSDYKNYWDDPDYIKEREQKFVDKINDKINKRRERDEKRKNY